MTAEQYLETEFARYFPEASIEATFHGDETIEITVKDTPASDPDYTFIMTITSDDHWYSFSDGTMTITVPLAPSED